MATRKRKETKDTAEMLELVSERDSGCSDQDALDEMSDDDSAEEEAAFEPVESDLEWKLAEQSGVNGSFGDSEVEEKRTPIRRGAKAKRGRGRKRRGGSSGRTQTSTPDVERWRGVDEPDITPPQPTFCPSRAPGSQVIVSSAYSAVNLFQLFFTNTLLLKIIKNTNEYGRVHCSSPANPWMTLTLQDMFSFLSVLIYMGFVKCTSIPDYWRGGNLYCLPFPRQVMSREKWGKILQALHLSSAEDDAANEAQRGTPEFDHVGKLKPVYQDIREACRQNYHPGQEISINERMVASKTRLSVKQYMKNKSVRSGFKFFILVDSSNGYTWDFFVSQGKTKGASDKGFGYNTVMRLMDTKVLGTGYKLFVNRFYTSPALFRDLLKQRIWACGTIRTNAAGLPKTSVNALDTKSPLGSIRWIRTGSVVFVQWRDTKDVFLCSTIHKAHEEETVRKKARDDSGNWTVTNVSVPLPPAIKDYNRCMGEKDVSDALIGYYQVFRKARTWYKSFFYHFVDIAVGNAFVLHRELCKTKGQVPMTQKAFRETLTEQLMLLGSPTATTRRSQEPPTAPVQDQQHRLVFIGNDRTSNRLKCRMCNSKTAVKCSTCDKALCFVTQRDCYNKWHDENM